MQDRAGTPVVVDPGIDILIVSNPGTTGWGVAARGLHAAFERTGATVVTVDPGPVREVRTFMATDLVQASAARKAALIANAEYRPEAIVYCSITAALLWSRAGVIWLDALAAENRPGRHGLWQRPLERRKLTHAPLLMTMAPESLAPLARLELPEQVVVPVPVSASGPIGGERDVDVVAYVADPVKRPLAPILEAWARARRDGETLVVTGREQAPAEVPEGVRFAGRLPNDEYRALLRRARVFLAAPRREDFGIGALEALADGAMLVTTPAPGPYPALGLARRLDPRLVGDDLVSALRHALDDPVTDYAARAAELVAAFSPEAVSGTLSRDVLPHLLPGWRG
jgi:hypothetical protein